MQETYTGRDVVEIAAQIERNTRDFYLKLANSAKDTRIWNAYTFLAEQEKEHEKLFRSMLQEMPGEAKQPEVSEERYREVKHLTQSSLYSRDSYERAVRKEAVSDAQAMETAIGFEKYTIDLYLILRDLVSEADQDTVDHVIEEERSHFKLLSDLRREIPL